jgi:hypothetical protein
MSAVALITGAAVVKGGRGCRLSRPWWHGKRQKSMIDFEHAEAKAHDRKEQQIGLSSAGPTLRKLARLKAFD